MERQPHWQGPTRCLEAHPNPRTVEFGGRYISLKDIAGELDCSISYLSRIFDGYANPSVAYLRRVSDALGMSLDEFLLDLDEKLADKQERLRRRLA